MIGSVIVAQGKQSNLDRRQRPAAIVSVPRPAVSAWNPSSHF
jgi:hypothetical protein